MKALRSLLDQAIALHQQGEFEQAESAYRQVLEKNPRDASALHLLGLLCAGKGDMAQAEAMVRSAVAIDERYAEAHNNLGKLLCQQGRHDEAIACHRRSLALREDAETYYSLGLTLQAKGDLAAALQAYVDALERRSHYPEVLNNLGNVLRDLGQTTEAEACLRQALAQRPDMASTHYNLARLLQQQGGRAAEALSEYDACLSLMPRLAEAAYNRALLLYDNRQLDAAVDAYRQLLEWAPGYTEAWNNLAKALRERGQAGEAAVAYQRALAQAPDDAEVFSNYLFLQQHLPGADGLALLDAHRAYAARFEAAAPAPPAHGNSREADRVLRVGLVSADFCAHPLANFLEPVLARHDRSQVELICLSNSPQQDETTLRLRALADGWQLLHGLSDHGAAELVRSLSIDILIDLSGHTAGNRLGLFILKPAPLQLTWLGYIGTTGLRAIDARITDALADPPGLAEAWHSEALLRMPHSQWCYRPHAEAPPVSAPPFAAKGFVTFASFNNVAKLSDELLDLWGCLLAELPSARLLVAGAPPGVARQRMVDRLAGQGVSASRLDFRERTSVGAYLGLFGEADIALDAFPYQGGTTTCDALWMGVPVLSLTGQRSVARSGVSLLGTVGLQDWVLDTPQAFLAQARKWAGNAPDLGSLRLDLRARIKNSPLMDETGFVRDWEALLRKAWRAWCKPCRCEPW